MQTMILKLGRSMARGKRRDVTIGAFAACSEILLPYEEAVFEELKYDQKGWEKRRWHRPDWKTCWLFIYDAAVPS